MARFTTNDGVGLHYTDAGTGRPVVLVHGYTAPATAWALTEDALLATGHRVVCLDRRSAGESDTPMFGQRMSRHGRDLAELLAHLGLDGAVLVGASMGGNVIWAYADQYGTGALAGVVVVDQTPKMVNTPDWPYGFYGLSPENVGTFFAEGVPDTGRGRPTEASAEAMGRLIQRLGGVPAFRDPAAPETLGLLQDHAHQDWRDVVARADCPVLMVAGRDSQVWSCEHAEAAVRDLPRGRAVVIEDAGHTVGWDQPDAFNHVLLDFIAGLGDSNL
jgi:pimeloyl-ACP methyl ester carboxylesterase